jgi:hypothetical protein
LLLKRRAALSRKGREGTATRAAVVSLAALKLAAEGAMLQRGEQRVELGNVSVVMSFELVSVVSQR